MIRVSICKNSSWTCFYHKIHGLQYWNLKMEGNRNSKQRSPQHKSTTLTVENKREQICIPSELRLLYRHYPQNQSRAVKTGRGRGPVPPRSRPCGRSSRHGNTLPPGRMPPRTGLLPACPAATAHSCETPSRIPLPLLPPLLCRVTV